MSPVGRRPGRNDECCSPGQQWRCLISRSPCFFSPFLGLDCRLEASETLTPPPLQLTLSTFFTPCPTKISLYPLHTHTHTPLPVKISLSSLPQLPRGLWRLGVMRKKREANTAAAKLKVKNSRHSFPAVNTLDAFGGIHSSPAQACWTTAG